MSEPRWTISIDAGGTFTDAIARRADGAIREAKVASTPDDPSRGLFNAVAALADQGVPREDVSLVCHGTTVATNATLTGNLARIALVTTRGFRDVLGYRQSNRPDVYSLTPARPTELVQRGLRYEVTERLDSAGNVVTDLAEDELDEVIERIREEAPEAIAVSFLFSYLNDGHEARVGAALREAFPETPVTLSSEVAREFREYPRTATAGINAALRPLVERYLNKASNALAESGVEAPFVVMQSNGGSVPAERAGVEAHRLVLSGPAGGVAGLVALAEALDEPHLISLDMGGTSTDVCLVRDGQLPFTTLQDVQDHTLLAPSVDIHTIGAGGGSIAWIDSTGRLRVGPESAKAVPGPACYSRGGTRPTITDAHAVLGTLGTGELAGGLVLDREKAREAVRTIAEPLGFTIEEGAEAILAIGLAHMVRALRKVSVERGLDPREFSLVPFGGAGPLHTGLLLRHMDLKQGIVPLRPGLFSADGLLVAGLRSDHSQTVLTNASDEAYPALIEWFDETSASSRSQLEHDGVPADHIREEASVDCRYRGQGFELSIPIADWSLESLQQIPALFHEAHRERYGHSNLEEPVEIVTIRLASTGEIDRIEEHIEEVPAVDLPEKAIVARRDIILPGYGELSVQVIERSRIPVGARFEGPAVIQQMDATTVILPEQTVEALSTHDLIVTDHSRKA
ncbi:MAG: hydantoinase/oxoprolinase family protein [Leucobacter sp.]